MSTKKLAQMFLTSLVNNVEDAETIQTKEWVNIVVWMDMGPSNR